LNRDDAKRQGLKEADQLIDQQLAGGAPTTNSIVLKATLICLQEGAKPALSFCTHAARRIRWPASRGPTCWASSINEIARSETMSGARPLRARREDDLDATDFES
jgi:hypothetical protein